MPMNNYFIPLRQAKIAIVDGRVDNEIVTNLEKLNITVVKSIECKEIDSNIWYHPDMVMHPISYDTLVVAPNVYDYYNEALSPFGIKVIKGETILEKKYPNDIAYNVARLNDIAIHNFKYTDEVLKFYFKKESIELLEVKQGYSKCSLAIIDNMSGITADKYMYDKLTDKGYKVLLIEPGYIDLEGYSYGFIGGACGNLSKNKILFSGKFDNHPDYKRIVSFIKSRNMEIVILSENHIIDIGTIITLS